MIPSAAGDAAAVAGGEVAEKAAEGLPGALLLMVATEAVHLDGTMAGPFEGFGDRQLPELVETSVDSTTAA